MKHYGIKADPGYIEVNIERWEPGSREEITLTVARDLNWMTPQQVVDLRWALGAALRELGMEVE